MKLLLAYVEAYSTTSLWSVGMRVIAEGNFGSVIRWYMKCTLTPKFLLLRVAPRSRSACATLCRTYAYFHIGTHIAVYS